MGSREIASSLWAAAGKDPRYLPVGLETRLGLLVEECGEVLAAAGKTLRSVGAYAETNAEWLLRECKDLRLAIELVELSLKGGDE